MISPVVDLSGWSRPQLASSGTTEVVPFPTLVTQIVLISIRSCEAMVQGEFSELVFVGVADHAGDAGQGGDFRGGALGVASGDDDFSQRVLALNPADGGAGILIGGMCDGAGVQDDEVGLGGWRVGEAAAFELAFEGGAIGLSGAASKVFDVEGGHGTMVAHIGGFAVSEAVFGRAEESGRERVLRPLGLGCSLF